MVNALYDATPRAAMASVRAAMAVRNAVISPSCARRSLIARAAVKG